MIDTSPVQVQGPHDISEIGSPLGFTSFGSILMPPIEGVSVSVEVDDNGSVVAVNFEHQGSILQVSAFASAKSESLWPEVYAQLGEVLRASGSSVLESLGTFGKQLDGRLETGDDARDLRFIGFDGPRWFLRGNISGIALQNAEAAENMENIFASLVVDRGETALPPREPLPLRVPEGHFVPPKFGA